MRGICDCHVHRIHFIYEKGNCMECIKNFKLAKEGVFLNNFYNLLISFYHTHQSNKLWCCNEKLMVKVYDYERNGIFILTLNITLTLAQQILLL